ncbi:MAG: ABC transporter ATP-binding protein [Mycobacteriales bacterium]
MAAPLIAQPAAVHDAVQVVPIRTSGLTKVFRTGRTAHRGDVVAVDGIDLAVGEGVFFGLLGPNGAGKSTTIGMLTTRVLPTSGRAEIAGIDVVRHPAAAKRLIGVVTQTNTLDRALTVGENLEFHGRYFGMSGRAARSRSRDLLTQFRLADRSDAGVAALSGGMAQRLMIARALVHRPRVLFLDEPTSGIDPQTRLVLWDLLRELHADGQTILLTTHYMEEADTLCDRVAIIDQGRILADGPPAELKRGLGAETLLTLRLAAVDGGSSRLRDAAARMPGVGRVEEDGEVLRVFAADSAGLLADLVAAAVGLGVRITDATSQPPTLEAVFLSLTGRDLRE